MEHPLSCSPTWLSSVLEASLSGILVFEPAPDASGEAAEYRAVFANRAATELLGLPPDRLVGNSLSNLFPNAAILRVQFNRVVRWSEAQRFEFDFVNPARGLTGRTWFDASVNGLDGHVVMSFIDVTATRQVQAQAEKTIARLHSVLDGSPAAIGMLEAVRDPDTSCRIVDFTIVSLNEQFCALMRYAAADLIGRRFRRQFRRSLTAPLFDKFVRVVESGVLLHEHLHFDKGPLQGWFDLTAVRQGDGLTITVLDVTAYRAAEEAARHAAVMLETALDRAQAGVTWHHAVRNPDGEIEDFQVVAINEASAQLFSRINPGLRGQALEGRRLSQFFPQAWDLGLFDRFVNVVETGEPVRYERTYPTEAGDLWFDVSAVKEDDGLILTFVDITRSKEAELDAEATAELLGGVFDASPWAIVYLAPAYNADGDVVDFTFQLANAKAEEIGRRPLPELIGGRMLELYPHTRDMGLFEEYRRVLETGKPFEREVFFEQGDIAVWSHITAVRQGEGIVLTNTDVTTRKRAELQNEESLRLLQGVLTSAPTAIYWLEAVRDPADPARIVDFSFALFNAHTAALAHRAATDLHAQPLRHLFPHADKTGLFADYVRVVETGQPLQRDVFYDWDGIHGWFHLQAARHGDGLIVQALDITERKRAEAEALRLKDELAQRATDQYRALFNAIDQGFCVLELIFDEANQPVDYRYTDVNPAFERQTGFTNVLGRTIRELQPRFDPAWVEGYGRVALTGEPLRTEAFVPTLNGWFEVYAFRTDQPEDRRVAVLFNNISERKRTEANLTFLAEVSQDLVSLTNIDETMNALGAKIALHFGLAACAFAELRENAQIGVISHGWHRADMPSLLGTYRMEEFVTPEVLRRCRAGEAVVIRDVFADPLTDGEQYAALHIGSFVSMPLVRDGEWRFLLVVYRSEPYDWRNDEIELLRELTTRIWTRLERARAEEDLRRSEQRLRRMVNVPRVGVLTFTVTGELLHANDAFLEMVGYDREQFGARRFTWRDFTPPEHVEASERIMEQLRQTGRGGPYEKEYVRSDGSRVWMMFVAADLGDGTIVEYAVDTSDRKRAEEALRRKEETYRADLERQVAERTAELHDQSRRLNEAQAVGHVGSFEWNVGEPHTHWSDELYRINGIEPQSEPTTLEASQGFIHPDDWPRLQPLQARAMQTPGLYGLVHRIVRRDGAVRWVDHRFESLADETGAVVRVRGTVQDITERKELELATRHQAKMLAGILDNSANSMAVYQAERDARGRIVDFRVKLFNRMALETAGLNWADVQGKTLLQLDPHSRETGLFHAAAEVVETGVSQTLTRDFPHLGKSFSLALSRFNGNGLIVGSVDITELRKAQRHQEALLEDLRKSNLNLEQFAYVTSHDLQEPLRKIQSFGTMLAKRLGDRLDPTEADLIHRMQDAASRMKILIEDLLTFSRLSSKKKAFRWLHLDRLVREVLGDLESTIQEKSAVVRIGSLPRLKGDAMQWRQLLQNLLSNALKFTRPGVVPEVRVEARTVTATDCPDVFGLRENQTYWEFSVADNGIGFDDQYREKIFDMFQRLHGRAEYAGTGIGLAIAKKVAEQHGGCVSAHGVPGQGATFRVYVPTASPTEP